MVSGNGVKTQWKNMIWILFVAVLYLLLFSAYTSPLFPKYLDWDSAIFMMVGEGINSGKQLYTEIFDHKGPVLFWLEALGMLFGRNGVFLLQCIFMTINIALMERIAEFFCQGKKKYIAIVAALIWLAYPLGNGNMSEEYSLPFILWSTYLFLKDWKRDQTPKLSHSYIYGICLGILFFIRANNAVTICAIILGWAYILTKRKEIWQLMKHLLVGIVGIATVTVPICVYFLMKGSLWEMIYATFLFNLQYSGNTSFLDEFANPVMLFRMGILFSPLLIAAVVFFREVEDKELRVVLEIVLGLNFVLLFLGHGYNHYFTVILPIVLLLFVLVTLPPKGADTKKRSIWKTIEWIGVAVVLVGYCVLAARIVVKNFQDYYVDKAVLNEYETVQESFTRIPEEERDSVLGYEIPAKYYLMGNVLPCYKYGILQFHWSLNDENVMKEFLNYIEMEAPLWLISELDTSNVEFMNIVGKNYKLMWEDGYAEYYRLQS